jgi:hypothetical protein
MSSASHLIWKGVMKMPKAVVTGFPGVDSDGDVKKLRSGTRQLVKKNKGKLTQFDVDNGILTIEIDNEAAFEAVCEQLRRFTGVSLATVTSAFDELFLQYEKQPAKAE